MKAYSMDLRERIIAAIAAVDSVEVVARRFGVGARTVRTYRARATQGELAPRPIPGKPSRLRPEQECAFVAMMQEHTDWTLAQLSQEWEKRSGVMLPRSTLHDHVRRLRGRYKKESCCPGTLCCEAGHVPRANFTDSL